MGKLSMRKISELLRQRYELNCSHRDIADSLGVSNSTVSQYLARAKASGVSWPLPENITDEDLWQILFKPTPIEDNKHLPLPDWEAVHKELHKKGVTLCLVWQEYRQNHPVGLSYSQFCRRYQDYRKTVSPTMRQVHKAGEKTFVDYAGMTVEWISQATGEIHEAQIFVGCLGASQFTFVEATETQQLPDWIGSHTRMFEFFNGVSAVLVPDNLKGGVTKAHRYDPDINANYQEMSEHYGIAIVPARVVRPKDKAKVENAVGCIETQILAPLRHCTFTSIAEINEAIRPLLERFNAQSFQKMKTSRRELFETIDRPALKPLPPERYQHADWKKVRVHIDYHITFDHHHYSVPFQHIQKLVDVRATAKTVECFCGNQRIAVHVRSHKRYGYTTLSEHMPPAHAAHAKWTPERMRNWARSIGEQTAKFMEHMIVSRPFPQQAFRACLGVLRLGKIYGNDRLEQACARALAVGATRYQQIESMLKNRLENSPSGESSSTQSLPTHDNIRGSKYYH